MIFRIRKIQYSHPDPAMRPIPYADHQKKQVIQPQEPLMDKAHLHKKWATTLRRS